ncbi:MAG: hypothetical protein ACR2RB_00040 [Gammaproteobacteria bacterium]
MAADYNQPANMEKRVRFFDGQYLLDQDFIDEQKYHIDRQHRHHRTLHIAGIADGLEVKPAASPTANAIRVTVTAGTAIDPNGRQLALARDQTVDLVLSKFRSKTASIYIVYAETAVDPQKAGGVASDSRWRERPEVVAEVKGQAITRNYPLLLLGELTLDSKGAVTSNDTLVREYSGLRLPGPGATPPTLRSDAGGRVTLAGGLAVTGNVGIGTAGPGALLHVRGAADPTIKIQSDGANEISGRLALHESNDTGADIYYDGTSAIEALRFDVLTGGNPSATPTALCISNNKANAVGNVGIGTTDPQETLHVNGSVRGNQSGALRISTGSGYVDVGPKHGEFAHFYTDRPGYYFDHAIRVQSGAIGSHDGNLTLQTSGTTRMTLNSNGHVGIDTTSPQVRLEVAGAVATKKVGTTEFLRLRRPAHSGVKNANSAGFSVGAFEEGQSGRARLDIKLSGAPGAGNQYGSVPDVTVMSLLASGNVGIGKTDPQQTLDVNGRIHVNDGVIQRGGAAITDTSDLGLYCRHSGHHIRFVTNGAPTMFFSDDGRGTIPNFRIEANGSVGIGGTAPSHPLHVTTAKANDWQAGFTNNGGANVYLSHADGYGMHINTGQANSSSRYGLEIRNRDGRYFYARDDGYVRLGHGAYINEFSTDGNLGGNSDNAVPTEKAVRAYVDARIREIRDLLERHTHLVNVTASWMVDARVGNHRHKLYGWTNAAHVP